MDKFYDCFIVNPGDNLDLMKQRIEALKGEVIKFIVVQAIADDDPTAENPLVAGKDQFAEYGDQIVYVTPDGEPSKESNQNAIMKGLAGCADGDLVHFASLIELPTLGTQFDLAKKLATQMPIALVMNGQFSRPWNPKSTDATYGVGSCLTTYAHINEVSPRTVRHLRKFYFRVYNTGTVLEPTSV